MVNVDKALIVGDFNIHVDNTNDALGLAFTDLINSFVVKQNVTGPTHNFNHTLDLIISHGIDLTDTDIIPQSDDVTDHFLVSCMLHTNDINYMAPRYFPGRTIVPATKDRFINNLPDLSQLLCVPITTDELDTITSNMGTSFSNTLETVAPIKLKSGQWFLCGSVVEHCVSSAKGCGFDSQGTRILTKMYNLNAIVSRFG